MPNFETCKDCPFYARNGYGFLSCFHQYPCPYDTQKKPGFVGVKLTVEDEELKEAIAKSSDKLFNEFKKICAEIRDACNEELVRNKELYNKLSDEEKKLPEPRNGCEDCIDKEPYCYTKCGIRMKMNFCATCGRPLFGGWEDE